MPKKFATENTKSVAARERKKQAKDEQTSKKQKDLEDAYWKDDDKQAQKKQQKKVNKCLCSSILNTKVEKKKRANLSVLKVQINMRPLHKNKEFIELYY